MLYKALHIFHRKGPFSSCAFGATGNQSNDAGSLPVDDGEPLIKRETMKKCEIENLIRLVPLPTKSVCS